MVIGFLFLLFLLGIALWYLNPKLGYVYDFKKNKIRVLYINTPKGRDFIVLW